MDIAALKPGDYILVRGEGGILGAQHAIDAGMQVARVVEIAPEVIKVRILNTVTGVEISKHGLQGSRHRAITKNEALKLVFGVDWAKV